MKVGVKMANSISPMRGVYAYWIVHSLLMIRLIGSVIIQREMSVCQLMSGLIEITIIMSRLVLK